MDPAVTRRVRAPCISCNTRPTLLKIFTSILTYVHKIYVHSQIYSLAYSRLRGRGPGPGFQIVTGGHSKHGQTFFFSRLRVHKVMQGTVRVRYLYPVEIGKHGGAQRNSTSFHYRSGASYRPWPHFSGRHSRAVILYFHDHSGD